MTGKTENNFEAVRSAWAAATAGASERPDNRESLRAKAAPLMLPQGVINAMKMEAAKAAESEQLKKITIQELQDLAVDEVSALVSDFDHGYSFSARLAVKLPVDAVSDISLAEFIFIDVEVHRTDSHPFKTVLPLMYSHGCGFRFMFGEDGDSDTSLSAEAFWYFMFACALDYCEAARG